MTFCQTVLSNLTSFFLWFPSLKDIPNSDSESFNPALWEEQRKHRAQVAFECDEDKDERETPPRVSYVVIYCLLLLHFVCSSRFFCQLQPFSFIKKKATCLIKTKCR